METQVRTVWVTAPDAEVGERLARSVVEEGLAACANLVPGVVSIYRWEGEVQRDTEVLLVLKTTADRCDALRDRLVALHPYDVPEFLAHPVVSGHPAYLQWVHREVAATP